MNYLYVIFLLILGNVQFCHSESTSRKPILPNINDLVYGYDMLIGTPVLAFRGVVWNFTTNNNITHNVNNRVYQIPDQVVIINYPSFASSSTNQVYTTSIDIQKTVVTTYSAGFDNQFIPGMFSMSHQVTTFQEQYYGFGMLSSTSFQNVTTWIATINPTIVKFADEFKKDLDDLPDAYNSTTCKQFKFFVKRRGTHAFLDIVFGGSVIMSSMFSVEITKTKTIVQIRDDLHAQFGLSVKASITQTEQKELDTLNAQYKSTFKLVGGDPSKYNYTEWQAWEKTVGNNPVPVSYKVIPHSEFSKSAAHKMALEKAIHAYMLTGSKQWQIIKNSPFKSSIMSGTSTENKIYQMDASGVFAVWSPKIDGDLFDIPKWQPLIFPERYHQLCSMAATSKYVYTLGGANNRKSFGPDKLSKEFWRYDLKTNSWNRLPDLVKYVGVYGVSIVNKKDGFIAIGGLEYASAYSWSSIPEIAYYNETSQSWKIFGLMPEPRTGCSPIIYQNKLYLFGGINYKFGVYPEPPSISRVDVYDLITFTWSSPTVVPDPAVQKAFLVNDMIYVVATTKLYIYNPQTNIWTSGPSLATVGPITSYAGPSVQIKNDVYHVVYMPTVIPKQGVDNLAECPMQMLVIDAFC